MPLLQQTAQFLKFHVSQRGWSPILLGAARYVPMMRCYQARLSDGDYIHLDLSNRMSYSLFYHGRLPQEGVGREILRRSLSAGSGFVDIGANLGYYTRAAARIVGSSGAIVAFEPEHTNFALLTRNTEEFPQVRREQKAVSDRCGTARFYVHNSRDQSSLVQVPSRRTITVETITLDSIARTIARPIDLIKIDIEGAELRALSAGRRFLEQHTPVVYFETVAVDASRERERLATFTELFASVTGAEYGLFRAHTNEEPLRRLSETSACEYLVAVPKRFAPRFQKAADK